MDFLTSIIDLDSIRIKQTSFSPSEKKDEILALSHSIVELEGLVNIPIVRQINLEEYELISGYLEYFAYAQASKMSSKIPDRISVFIADKKSLAAVTQQLEILQAIEYIEPSSVLLNSKSDNVQQSLRIGNLETSLAKLDRQFVSAIQQLKLNLLEEIKRRDHKLLPLLEAFNNISNSRVVYELQRRLEAKEFLGPTRAKKFITFLQKISQDRRIESFQEVLDFKMQQGNRSIRFFTEKKLLGLVDSFQTSISMQTEAHRTAKEAPQILISGHDEINLAIAQIENDVLHSLLKMTHLQISPLEAFNRIQEPEVAFLVQRKLEFLGLKKSASVVMKLQEVARQNQFSPFQSFGAVIETLQLANNGNKPVRMLTEKTILAVLDRWN
jgi:hypothetical protein